MCIIYVCTPRIDIYNVSGIKQKFKLNFKEIVTPIIALGKYIYVVYPLKMSSLFV